ncbi:MAG: hypothetical protein KAW56_04310, partial [Candidatus Marinimicrobia bacterium]|nr:hypothetical protein [Candidatus Neomarinimicrobiota bacterium]
VKQATGCLASAWARLAAKVGEIEATRFLENEWECKIPEKVIEAGLMQKARFERFVCAKIMNSSIEGKC